MTTTRQPVTRPSRRTLVKGAAWATPVIAVASAAPAMANSPGCVDAYAECWTRNGTRFTFDLCFTNICEGRPAQVVIGTITVVSAGGTRTLTAGETSNEVQFGTPWCQQLSYTGGNANDVPQTISVSFTVGGLADSTNEAPINPCAVQYPNVQLEPHPLDESKDEQEVQPIEPEVTAVPEPEDTATESAPEPVVDQAEKTATPTSDN